MNAKICKQLRKSARLIFAQSKAAYSEVNPYVEIEKNRKIMLNRDNKPFFASAGTMVNNPVTVRGIYRSLKNNFRKHVKV
jgi:hypothetical protein